MDLDELRAALDNSLPPQLAPIVDTVLSLACPSAQLTVNDAGPHAGAYGGLPALPADVEWPHRSGQPLTLLAQLDCAVLSGVLGPAWTLPDQGTLLFFYDDATLGADEQAARVVHVNGHAPMRQAPADTVVIPQLPLTATPCWSLPEMGAGELSSSMTADPLGTLDVLSRISDLVPHTPHQVLGWLGDGYYPPHPQLRPLLQVEAEQGTAWGECVRIAFLVPDEDLQQTHLDRVRIAYEVA
ncbi:hypothetical protein Rhe02_59170 [Rhizocola hellebori]|uniref:DUF1963 domain-containing protein n=1 Tax=Rhizocola hellebori TaxID=1392758 RepID=A0A8J3QDX7_9ACTN|nr:DUF1963 domain-containing protein [Rhizocola hellebori]GIH07850.1 hypothetical protein Rhe02_59170 [Rhizocola hellebori]